MNSFNNTSPETIVTEKPLFLRIIPDILAFCIGLSLAWFLDWETKDLVWSLWLGSLTLGYLTLLSAIGGGAYVGIHALNHNDYKKESRNVFVFFGVIAGLFFLGFFSLHFCGFHAGHSVFLRQFFPIEGMPEMGFGAAFMNPPLLWYLVFKHLMVPYGLFLIPAIIAERKHIFQPLIKAVNSVSDESSPNRSTELKTLKKGGKGTQLLGDAMKRPYVNVVRMHMLIFFFAFSYFLNIDSFIVFTVVYFVYFFPWAEIKKLRSDVSDSSIKETQPSERNIK